METPNGTNGIPCRTMDERRNAAEAAVIYSGIASRTMDIDKDIDKDTDKLLIVP